MSLLYMYKIRKKALCFWIHIRQSFTTESKSETLASKRGEREGGMGGDELMDGEKEIEKKENHSDLLAEF